MQIYKSRPTTRRRRTNDEILQLKSAMLGLAHQHQPLTVRNLFYIMVSEGYIEKTEAEYKNVVVRLSGQMRESGMMPFHWIVDNTRWMRKQDSYVGLGDMLEQSTRLYRRDLWAEQPYYLEIWCESDSIAGVLYDVTNPWDIPLMVCRGFSSKTFLHNSIIEYREIEKPIILLYFGDYDPSGMAIDRQIKKAVDIYAEEANVTFLRLAVTEEWIQKYSLPERPPKKTDSRSKNWKGGTVELEAIPPRVLKDYLNREIETLIDQKELERVRLTEEAERKTLVTFMEIFKKKKR